MNLFKPKRRKTSPVDYTTEPVRASLFEPSPKERELTAATNKPRFVLYSPPRKGLIRLTKALRLSGHLPGLAPIGIELRHAKLEVIGLPDIKSELIGVPGMEYFVEARSQADAPNQRQARRLLDRAKLECEGDRVQFLNASNGKDRHCMSSLTIACFQHRPVTVRGVYAAVHLSDLSAGANIETTHARITILNVGPKVDARVEEGIIDYSGHQGSARLFAGWEINLNLTSQSYTGKFEATADGPVRILIPQAFTTAFEASVAKHAAFVCRADIGSQISHHDRAGRVIYRFGREKPVMRFTSRNGPIVIDNVPPGTSEGTTAKTPG
jgi:hypothetical protein